MMQDDARQTTMVTLSNKDFSRLKTFIYKECGINIIDSKRTMLEARLQKRLRKLDLTSFSGYCDYLFSPTGIKEELTDMINQVTTNKTDFFREPAHFDYLRRKVLPELSRTRTTIAAWSAGCSSGEEPYTLAIVLKEFGCDFTILGTDISTKVLDKAKLAVYDEREDRTHFSGTKEKIPPGKQGQDKETLSHCAGVEGTREVQKIKLHGRRLWLSRAPGYYLLPQRHHLFR